MKPGLIGVRVYYAVINEDFFFGRETCKSKRATSREAPMTSATWAELEEDAARAGLLDLIEKYRGRETVKNMCRRFLVARQNDRKKALKLLKAYLEWCEADCVLDIRRKTASQMLHRNTHPDGKVFHDRTFPHGMLGRCKQGRPILYQQFGADFDVKHMDKHAGLSEKDLADYYTWMMERAQDAMHDINAEGTWVIVADLHGWNVGQHFNMRHLRYTRANIERISGYYPERLFKIYLINVPSVFSKCWAFIRPMLDAATQAKVGLYGPADDYRKDMAEMFDIDLLPVHVGGKLELQYGSRHSLDPSPEMVTN